MVFFATIPACYNIHFLKNNKIIKLTITPLLFFDSIIDFYEDFLIVHNVCTK